MVRYVILIRVRIKTSLRLALHYDEDDNFSPHNIYLLQRDVFMINNRVPLMRVHRVLL